jgi:hypothetical protein
MNPCQLITFSPGLGEYAMDGGLNLRGKQREALRERWLKQAGAAFERMFGKENQDRLVTLTQREDMACALGEELRVFLLKEHIAADPQTRPSEKRAPCCPKCQRPAERVTDREEEELPERELSTRAGDITLRRQQWRCKKCRVLFFSARPQAGVGDGGV